MENDDRKKEREREEAARKEREEREFINEDLPDISCSASATECTGLMPTPPQDSDEMAAYQQLYNMEIPRNGANWQ